MFGAEETLLPLAQRYMFPIKFVVPSFLFTQLLSAFLRNDGDPALATKAVLFGGVFNVFGDYFFVFTLDMGIMGAVISGILIYLLPLAAGADSIWFVMPIAELTVAVFVGTMMRRYQKKAQKM